MLQASIAEAAFMTGMERNSDRVAMAAFAPLLSHSQDPACPHDLVIFDNHRCEQPPHYLVYVAAARESVCDAKLLLLHQHVLHQHMLAVLSKFTSPFCMIAPGQSGAHLQAAAQA